MIELAVLRRAAFGLALAAALSVAACSAKSSGSSTNPPLDDSSGTANDCSGRGEALSAGMTLQSSSGVSFELMGLDPSTPVQSAGPPGNTWSVMLRDANAAPITGATLVVTSYMPDHGHSGPPAVAVERGGGLYEVDGLVLPMPALYEITLSATATSSATSSVVLSICIGVASG